jgi:Histone methylation protein DOT1
VSSDFLDQLGRGLRGWWRQESRQKGAVRASATLVRELFEFLLDSTPERRRRRYGDMEYDWERRVNTTSGAVGWRERLLGVFHSPYQPTDPALFRQMMAELPIDFPEFIFVDLGSGKGRTLLLASEYAFRRIIGVEIVTELHRAAEEHPGLQQSHPALPADRFGLRGRARVPAARRTVGFVSVQSAAGGWITPIAWEPRKVAAGTAPTRLRALPQSPA